MDFFNTLRYTIENYRAMLRAESRGVSPKVYGMTIQGRRKKKKRR